MLRVPGKTVRMLRVKVLPPPETRVTDDSLHKRRRRRSGGDTVTASGDRPQDRKGKPTTTYR